MLLSKSAGAETRLQRRRTIHATHLTAVLGVDAARSPVHLHPSWKPGCFWPRPVTHLQNFCQ
jgi:hypothetical protein